MADVGPDEGGPSRPAACLGCHVEASASAVAAWGDPGASGTVGAACPPKVPYLACLAVGGDPVERAVAVDRLADGPDPDLAAAILATVLADPYPALRSMAARGLRRLALRVGDRSLAAAVAEFDAMGGPDERARIVEAVRRRTGPDPLADDPEARAALAAARGRTALWIGE